MRLTDRLLYIVLKLVNRFLLNLPCSVLYAGGRLLGRLGYYFYRPRRQITVANIRKAFPSRSPADCRRIALRVYENFGRNMMEFIKFSGGRIFDRVKVNGVSNFKEGALMLTGHLGNWEITGMSVAAAGMELYPVGRRIHNPAIDRIVDDLRTVYGGGHIPYRGSIREVLRKIKAQKNICVLIDQKIKTGLPVHFFRQPVWVTHFASVLHRRTGVKVIPSWSRHKDNSLEVNYEKPLILEKEGDSLRADFINTQRQIKWIEEKIKEKPDEWFWMHNFWKTRWRAVFLDRDGTLNVDHGYVSKKEDLKFYPGTFKALRELRKEGYLLIVITNQSGIARGYYTESDYRKLNEYFLKRLSDEGVFIDRVYHCSHHPDDDCYCRKPNPGMVLKAMEDFKIREEESFVVGDKSSDINLGKRQNLKTVMVMTGEGKNQLKDARPDFTASDIAEASKIIINEKN
ncbi:MAG: D-glycero-beta-D-manno-heptose 1,7-bisphosphate 7-phosphatase [Elusimicrobiota bacterium]|nr:D-glycero-beta-D-manno-heptose 1,7-bisphosphate 7-phosphatase [Elusimicrobiota bacterium]